MGGLMKLHLGVLDHPYTEEVGITTGEVAQILEDNYSVMAFFFNAHKDFIALKLEDDLAGALNDLLNGAPQRPVSDLFNGACGKIETKFRLFLDNKEMDYQVGGVPTQASLDGVCHRLKSKNRKTASRKGVRANEVRPSFIDTGEYQTSFKSWVES
jgi:hypothetical protein